MMIVVSTIILSTFYVQGTLHVLSVFLMTTRVNSLHFIFLKNESETNVPQIK